MMHTDYWYMDSTGRLPVGTRWTLLFSKVKERRHADLKKAGHDREITTKDVADLRLFERSIRLAQWKDSEFKASKDAAGAAESPTARVYVSDDEDCFAAEGKKAASAGEDEDCEMLDSTAQKVPSASRQRRKG